MSVVSSIIGSLHDVPASIVSGLNELRATDGRSHDIQLELAAAESAILNDLKNAIGSHFHLLTRFLRYLSANSFIYA